MNIQLLSAVRRDTSDTLSPTNRAWPPKAGLTTAAWVGLGDRPCVTLLTLHGKQDFVELPWGRQDSITGLADGFANCDGMSFARPCLVPAYQIIQACDAGEYEREPGSVSVTYSGSVSKGCALAGMWLPANPYVYQPVAFKLLMARAGPVLAAYCVRQPVIIAPEHFAQWLNPTMSTRHLQSAPVSGTFDVLELTKTDHPAAA